MDRGMDYDDVAFGGMGYGNSPCANCEDNPKLGGDLFCSDECRAEYEGDEDESTTPEKFSDDSQTWLVP